MNLYSPSRGSLQQIGYLLPYQVHITLSFGFFVCRTRNTVKLATIFFSYLFYSFFLFITDYLYPNVCVVFLEYSLCHSLNSCHYRSQTALLDHNRHQHHFLILCLLSRNFPICHNHLCYEGHFRRRQRKNFQKGYHFHYQH